MRKLPIGIQTFEILRQNPEEYVYVDKTRHIYDLVTQGRVYFLSRPRRFGKSLLCSTIQALFQGEKELFRGLWIEKSDWKWEQYPVVHISFGKLICKNAQELEAILCWKLESIAKKYKIDLSSAPLLGLKLITVIETLAEKNKVVVVIDEYDKPILDNITEKKKAEEIRNVLGSFYGIIKDLDEYLQFVFVTGVSKFSMTSIFSKFNNLEDISMEESGATLCGYTQQELENYFSKHLDAFSKKKKIPRQQLLVKIKHWYDGYLFISPCDQEPHGTHYLYNPFSVMLSLKHTAFKNYWFKTATPTFLVTLIKEKDYPIQKLDNVKATENELGAFDVDRIPLKTLLFQAGYLTIKDYQEELYQLGYANYEVQNSWLLYLMDVFMHVEESDFKGVLNELGKALKDDDIDRFCWAVRTFFAGVSYELLEKSVEKSFNLAFYILAKAIGADIYSEERTNIGRIDAVIVTEQKVYIFEMKRKKTPGKAIKQIYDKKYFEKYQLIGKPIVLIGLNFNNDEKNIDTNWVIETI